MEGIYKCPLFSGLEPQEVDRLLEDKYRMTHYNAGELIASGGDRYRMLLIVDRGAVRGEMTNFAGDRVVIEEIAAPRPIAPAILYATDYQLPVNVIAVTETAVIGISVENFTRILQSDIRVLHNFMRSISDRSKFLSDRVRLLRFGTIKSKLARYLLERRQQYKRTEFDIPHTHQELADMFGVTRPALSRAIGRLADAGAVKSHKNHFRILNEEKLKHFLRE